MDAEFDAFNDGTVNAEMRLFLPMIQRIGEYHPHSVTLFGLCLDSLLEPAQRFQFSPDNNYGENGADFYNAISLGYSQMGQFLVEEIFVPSFAERLDSRRFQSIEETLRDFPEGNSWERTRYFYFVNRGKRHINSGYTIYSCISDCVFPGLDYDLFDYAVKIPYEYVRLPTARLYRHTIEALHPALAEVPWDLTGLSLDKDPTPKSNRRRYQLNRAKYYLGRISRGVLDFSVPAISDNRLFRHHRGFRAAALNVLQDPRTISRGFFDREGIEKLIRLQDSGRNYFPIIWAIMTVEKFFRKIIDDG